MSAERKLSYLYAVVGLLSILAVSFLIALIVVLLDRDGPAPTEPTTPSPLPTQSPPTHGNYCLTDGCRKAAKNLRLSMNLQADPCDDFYE
ncbi:hypothetical protein D918_02567 [Trichuris suis]|nr:hypothetical protein D918_02567 [Trichuris suis]